MLSTLQAIEAAFHQRSSSFRERAGDDSAVAEICQSISRRSGHMMVSPLQPTSFGEPLTITVGVSKYQTLAVYQL